MILPYISLVNQLKMENLTRGRRAAPPFQFLPPLLTDTEQRRETENAEVPNYDVSLK